MRHSHNDTQPRFGLLALICAAALGAAVATMLHGDGPLVFFGAVMAFLAVSLLVTHHPDSTSDAPSDHQSTPAAAQAQIGAPIPTHMNDPRASEDARTTKSDEKDAATSPLMAPGAEGPQLPAADPETAEPLAHVSQVAPLSPPSEDADGQLEYAPDSEALVLQSTSELDFTALSDRLVESHDPLADLRSFVNDIKRRAQQDGLKPQELPPCELEHYAARVLEDAGIFDDNLDLPFLDVIRPQASRMVYLRCAEQRIPYGALVRVIKIEAALNAIRFASASLAPSATEREALLFNQRLTQSIVAQAAPIDQPLILPHAGSSDGEWAVRYGLSQAIESLQLPYRLTARYRSNVVDGNVAIEFDFTPADVFPATCYIEGLGIVPTSGDMRQRAAAEYALHLGILLAASAFRCSSHLRHVWVAAIHDNGRHRTCYLSVDFDRWRFARLDLKNLGDLAEVYRLFAPVMRYEDGWLRPVRQGFHIEEERFCPSRRYLPVSLSSRRLEGDVAERLGCDHVSALAIEESDGRALVANAIMMRLAPTDDEKATQKNVRTVMELAGDDPDPTVRSAAERVVRRLVDGTLESDPWSIGEEFIRGDSLTRATDRAKELLMNQKPEEAHRSITGVLACLDASGIYDDSDSVVYRYFGSYAERALYNRLQAASGSSPTVMLVPDAYYEAHLLVSVTALMLGKLEQARDHAMRLCALAPLDARSRLQLAACFEQDGQDNEAIQTLLELLKTAYEPMGIGLAYYRLASFKWRQGEVRVAQACYERAMRILPGSIPMIAMELSLLKLQHGSDLVSHMTQEEIEETLTQGGVPLVPSQQTSEAFYECAQASLDAEIFPVAKTFTSILGAFTGDDIIAGVIRSLDDLPDH